MEKTMEKIYYSYQEIHNTIRDMAQKIIKSGYEPDYLLAIGGGGLIPARILRTFIDKPIVTVTLSRYHDDGETSDTPVKHQWIDDILVDLNNKKILLIDEVDDCRTTLEYCIRELLKTYEMDISVFVMHNKLKEKHGVIPEEVKNVFIGKDIPNKWICYPWDALDIDTHVLLSNKTK
jgi:uncharacterized protein